MIQITFILLTLFAAELQTTDQAQHIAVKQTKPQPIVYIQHIGPYWTVGPVFRTLGQYMIKHGQTGSMYARYEKNPKKMRANKMRCEIGFWVEGQHQPLHPYKSIMKESELVAHKFVDTANPNISKQYNIMSEWIRSNDYEPLGPITEIHHRTFDRTGTHKLTVEIQMPVRKIQQRENPPSFMDSTSTERNHKPTLERNFNKKQERKLPASVQPEEKIIITPGPKQKPTKPIKKKQRPDTRRDETTGSRYGELQIPKFIENFAKLDRPKPTRKYTRPHPKTPPPTITPTKTKTPPRTVTPPRTTTPPPATKVFSNPDIKPWRPTKRFTKPATTHTYKNTTDMTITELIESEKFDRVAELIMSSPDSIPSNQEIWFGQIIFRLKAVARGLERMYPGEGGTVMRLVNALSSRYEIIAIRFERNPLDQAIVRVGSLNDPSAQSRRKLMRTMDSLLGQLAVKRLSADELQEEIFDVIDRLYDIMRDH